MPSCIKKKFEFNELTIFKSIYRLIGAILAPYKHTIDSFNTYSVIFYLTRHCSLVNYKLIIINYTK